MNVRDGFVRRPARVVGWVLLRGVRPIVILCALVVILGLIAASPLSLKLVTIKRGINWVQLSNIGQAYGAISAVLSGLALVAVSISIRFQSRQHLANRRQVHRDMHMRLTEMAMADSHLMQCWSPEELSFDQNRQFQYINLMISCWYMQWEMGDIKDEVLYSIACAQLFQGEAGRRYWDLYRDRWRSESLGSRINRFCEVLDNALTSVDVSGRTGRPKTEILSLRRSKGAAGAVLLASAFVVGGVIAGDVFRRWGRKSFR